MSAPIPDTESMSDTKDPSDKISEDSSISEGGETPSSSSQASSISSYSSSDELSTVEIPSTATATMETSMDIEPSSIPGDSLNTPAYTEITPTEPTNTSLALPPVAPEPIETPDVNIPPITPESITTPMEIEMPVKSTMDIDPVSVEPQPIPQTSKAVIVSSKKFLNDDNDFDFGSRPVRSRIPTKRFEKNDYDFFDSDSDDAPIDEDDEDFNEEKMNESSSDGAADDDDEDFGLPKRRTSARRVSTRTKRKPKKNFSESEEEVIIRRSERQTEKKSYIDEESSSDSDVPPPKTEIIGDVIERVLDKRETKIEKDENDNEIVVPEYLIKWKGWAHMHNTWETDKYLREFHGHKRVHFYEKQLQKEKAMQEMAGEENIEDIEQANILKELEKRKQKEWTKVERVVASKEVTTENGEEGTRYFVKWKGLPYDQNTWEEPKDIAKFQDKIDSFLAREQRNYTKRNTSWRKHRPKIAELKQQPQWLNHAGTLRSYQLEGLNWLIQCWSANTNCILADEMGLGKTIQTVSFLSWLQFEQDIPGPFLVVVPLSTVDNWMKEFNKWAPLMNVVLYIGNSASRQIIREYEFGSARDVKVNVIVSTFELVLKDKLVLQNYRWIYLCVDEAHRLKNCDSQLHDVLSSFKVDNRLLITGTPLQNSLRELWSLLNFLHPNRFPSLSEFEDKYLNLDTTENQGKIQALHAEIGPHLLRRYKKQVEKSLPSKSERILRVQLSPMQKMYYKLILARNLEQLNRSLQGRGKKASLINIVVELRKCCNHPYLFQGVEDRTKSATELVDRLIKNSGKLILLHKLLTRLKETGHRVLIFSQMVRMLDILADYLKSQHFQFQRLDGSMGHDLRRTAMENFNAPDSKDFCFLLSTRAGGLGINLSTADTVIIYDSDWNPQNDLQAVARAHRIGQTKVVNIYRLVSQNTVEEEILERAKKKMVLDHLVIQRMDSGKKVLSDVFSNEDFASILQFSAQALFADKKENQNPENEEDMDLDLDDILSRAEETEENDSGPLSAAEELLSSFKVSTLRTTFDESEGQQTKSEQNPSFWNELLPNAEEENEPVVLAPRRRTVTSYAEFGSQKRDTTPTEQPEAQVTGKRSRRLSNLERGANKKRRLDYDSQPLTVKEIRLFLRSLRKFANIDRLDEIAGDCNLSYKKTTVLRDIAEEVFQLCEDACRVTTSNTYIDYHSVSVNASELLQRRDDLEHLGKKIESYKAPSSFRMKVKIKPANFQGIIWSPKDDSMLLWGAYHYGIGNWESIREDPDLGLGKKISSSRDDSKVTGSQLLRRLEGLFRSLRQERAAKEKAAAAAAAKKTRSKKSTKRSKKEKKKATKPPPKKRTRRNSKVEEEESHSDSENTEDDPLEVDQQLMLKAKRLLRGSRAVMKDFRDLSEKELSKEDRIAETKRCLITIGENIEEIVVDSRRDKEKLRRHLWHFVSETTQTQPGDNLRRLYERLRGQLA